MSNIDYTLWPTDGQLGETKFPIPTDENNWPLGDALVGNFVYNKGKLVSFVDTAALIANESGTTTFPYNYVNITLPSIADGEMTYIQGSNCKHLIINNEDLSVFKYKGCKTVDDVKAVDPNYLTNDIVDGVWSERIENLEDGYEMFSYSNIASISSDLSSLTNAQNMFRGSKITYFYSKIPKLTNGNGMFKSCFNLASFSSDLSTLTNGTGMFYDCFNLTTFTSDLSTLTNGNSMFMSCSNLKSFNSICLV